VAATGKSATDAATGDGSSKPATGDDKASTAAAPKIEQKGALKSGPGAPHICAECGAGFTHDMPPHTALSRNWDPCCVSDVHGAKLRFCSFIPCFIKYKTEHGGLCNQTCNCATCSK
jgi:hypothetical protein